MHKRISLVALLGLGLVAGCTPAGPKALLDGKEFLDEGRPAQAVKRLETAVTLMPTNAQAFNYLGLAYHMAGQVTNAQRAYYRAVQLNPDLSEARYNLGCLYLEANLLDAAKGEFSAYTMRLPKAANGWIQLGTTQHRARDYANAERSFNEALRLSPGNAEALNGLGMARLQRGRVAEARQSFEAALQAEADYPAALLNLAILHQQHFRNGGDALALYKRYAALQPSPPRAGEVNGIIRQLEAALALPPAVTAAAPAPVSNSPALAAPAPAPANLPPPATSGPPVVAAQPAPQRVVAAPPPTNSVRTAAPGTPVVRTSTGTVRVASLPLAGQATANSASQKGTPGDRPTAASPPVRADSNSLTQGSRPAERVLPPAERVVLSDEPRVVGADAASPIPRPTQPTTGSATATATPAPAAVASRISDPRQATAAQPPQKRGFFRKLNPLNLLPDKKDEKSPVYAASTPQPQPTLTPQPATPAAQKEETPPSPRSASLPRYAYRSPGAPRAGDRAGAERAFATASSALNAQRPSEAVLSLRAAVQLDPSYFEAHYNLGVVLARAGDAPGALASYENALAARPQSVDARYNFALLLKQSGYVLDAASELEKLLKTSPGEARAHLAAGNMYAEQLKQPALAREHYRRFLELEPRSSQAGTVRYWLATN